MFISWRNLEKVLMRFVLHCIETPIYVFLFWELRGPNPNFHIHLYVSDLCISRIGPHISCSRIGRPIVGIYESLTDTWMWKLELWPCSSFSGIFVSNFRYWFFSVQCALQVVESLYINLPPFKIGSTRTPLRICLSYRLYFYTVYPFLEPPPTNPPPPLPCWFWEMVLLLLAQIARWYQF